MLFCLKRADGCGETECGLMYREQQNRSKTQQVWIRLCEGERRIAAGKQADGSIKGKVFEPVSLLSLTLKTKANCSLQLSVTAVHKSLCVSSSRSQSRRLFLTSFHTNARYVGISLSFIWNSLWRISLPLLKVVPMVAGLGGHGVGGGKGGCWDPIMACGNRITKVLV